MQKIGDVADHFHYAVDPKVNSARQSYIGPGFGGTPRKKDNKHSNRDLSNKVDLI